MAGKDWLRRRLKPRKADRYALTDKQIHARDHRVVFGSWSAHAFVARLQRPPFNLPSTDAHAVAQSLLDLHAERKLEYASRFAPPDAVREASGRLKFTRESWMHPDDHPAETLAQWFVRRMTPHFEQDESAVPELIRTSHDPAELAHTIESFQGRPVHVTEPGGNHYRVHLLDLLSGMTPRNRAHALEAIRYGGFEGVMGLVYLPLEGRGATPRKVRRLFEAAYVAGVPPGEARSRAHEVQRQEGNFDSYLAGLQRRPLSDQRFLYKRLPASARRR